MRHDPCPITGHDLFRVLNGSQFKFDREKLTEEIDALRQRIESDYTEGKMLDRRPRILITGCPMGGATEKVINASSMRTMSTRRARLNMARWSMKLLDSISRTRHLQQMIAGNTDIPRRGTELVSSECDHLRGSQPAGAPVQSHESECGKSSCTDHGAGTADHSGKPDPSNLCSSGSRRK